MLLYFSVMAGHDPYPVKAGEVGELDYPTEVEEEVHIMLAAAPELLSRYARLLEEADDDPGVVAFLGDLAEHVSRLAERLGPATRTALAELEPCLRALEALAATCEEGADLVAWGFLDSLSDDELRCIAPYLGPATRSAAESLY